MSHIEIDFIGVETAKSGDAITIRYEKDGVAGVHVVDGGYIDTGAQVIEQLRQFYGTTRIENVVLTHPDLDHANGLRAVLEECDVGTLWLNRPWLYASELIDRFATYTSVDALERKLRSVYSASAALEEIAIRKGIPIQSPFQGSTIGIFQVLAPSKARYLDLIVESDKTPEAETSIAAESFEAVVKAFRAVANLVKSAWGDEYFPSSGTSTENEMSVVQYAQVNGKSIVLTGDAGREALTEAAAYAPYAGLSLPGIDMFQVPHHGGRHNVSTELLDSWLGTRHDVPGAYTWAALCSSAKADEDHPRKSVMRAMMHRGGNFAATEGQNIAWMEGISREGWGPVPQTPYPEEQED
ncbi:competence protein ComEC [Pseudomonas fluorescens]|nr:competence protein ComEC [Pseudomonas fluorescens]